MKEYSEKETNTLTTEYQIERLLNSTFINPYDIVGVQAEASEEEVKKKFRILSRLVHPDKVHI